MQTIKVIAPTMPRIHLIERAGNVHRVAGSPDEWVSGDWVISHDTAAKLVGGDLYLHSNQSEPSHFGGRIVGWHPHTKDTKRIVFVFIASKDYKGFRTGKDGWGVEKKIDW